LIQLRIKNQEDFSRKEVLVEEMKKEAQVDLTEEQRERKEV